MSHFLACALRFLNDCSEWTREMYCEHCDKGFARKWNLRRHIQLVHNNQTGGGGAAIDDNVRDFVPGPDSDDDSERYAVADDNDAGKENDEDGTESGEDSESDSEPELIQDIVDQL